MCLLGRGKRRPTKNAPANTLWGDVGVFSGDTYQYETLSVFYTHKHISVTKFVIYNASYIDKAP